MFLLVLGEGMIRIFSVRTAAGIMFFDTRLLPRSWDDVIARNRRLLTVAPSSISYLVADDTLGWTIGPSRESRNRLYSSSTEGIRAARQGLSYAAENPVQRIALVGDSFTFGLEVSFEDSWGYRLQQDLGGQVGVLNYGVDGYGVDQSYLRYVRDVRQWHPDLVIFGLINHDLYRSLAVYSFLAFPEWGFPFAKPRFVSNAGRLELLNVPLPSPDSILEYRSIADLPFIEYEPGYDSQQWEWWAHHRSYLVRFLLSRFPRWPEPRPQVSDEAVEAVNRAILASFVDLARAEGSIPMVVYFPTRSDFRGDKRDMKDAVLGSLRGKGMQYDDLSQCLARLSVAQLFIDGRPHYSPAGNAAVARCLSPSVRKSLGAKNSLMNGHRGRNVVELRQVRRVPHT
jgi:hypothetical protein